MNHVPNGSNRRTAWDSRPIRLAMLILALLPTGLVVAIALNILFSEHAMFEWHSTIWPVVILQVIAIVAFCVHARLNKALSPEEADDWTMQCILYIPFGTLSYWKRFLSE